MDTNNKQPRIFRGPIDGIEPVEQKFYRPIEAKIIRIYPLTWHNGIAVKVELIGCEDIKIEEGTTTTTERSTTTEVFLGSKYTEKVIKPGKAWVFFYQSSLPPSNLHPFNTVSIILLAKREI